MAAKTAKARKLAMLEAMDNQAIGDAADYERGREVRVYDSFSSRREIERRERFIREHRMLSPSEQWAVREGYMVNPFLHEKPTAPVWTPVDYADGTRRRFRSLEDGRAHLADAGAVRLWNPVEKKYEAV